MQRRIERMVTNGVGFREDSWLDVQMSLAMLEIKSAKSEFERDYFLEKYAEMEDVQRRCPDKPKDIYELYLAVSSYSASRISKNSLPNLCVGDYSNKQLEHPSTIPSWKEQ